MSVAFYLLSKSEKMFGHLYWYTKKVTLLSMKTVEEASTANGKGQKHLLVNSVMPLQQTFISILPKK